MNVHPTAAAEAVLILKKFYPWRAGRKCSGSRCVNEVFGKYKKCARCRKSNAEYMRSLRAGIYLRGLDTQGGAQRETASVQPEVLGVPRVA